MAGTSREVEIKIAVGDAGAAVERVLGAGFRVQHERTFESNVVYDTPGRALRRSGRLIRVRGYGEKSSVTYKGPATAGRHKEREELETGVGDGAVVRQILERLGYEVSFRYEKYRTEFTDGVGVVTVDETPMGNFLELEGAPEWIDEAAKRMGYGEGEYVTESYAGLWVRYREGSGEGDMVFEEKG